MAAGVVTAVLAAVGVVVCWLLAGLAAALPICRVIKARDQQIPTDSQPHEDR